MLILDYGNWVYILSILSPIVFTLILFLILKNREQRTQKIFILVLMFLNLFQHIFKAYVWYPIYHGQFDLIEITFCNVCATSIIVSPFIFLGKSSLLKDSLFYFGSIGGLFSMIVPYYFEGQNILTFDYLRFFSCHVVLFATSTLPVLLHIQDIKFSNFFKISFMYLVVETIVFADNVFFGFLTNGFDIKAAYFTFYNSNPLWICHMPLENDALGRVFVAFGLNNLIFDGNTTTLPVLWSAIPLYISLTIVFFFTNLALSYDADC